MKEQIKQLSILLGFVAIVIVGFVWFSNNPKSEPPTTAINGKSSGVLTLEESKYDFGTVSMAKGKVSKEFTLENKSQEDVNIGEVFTSCMCTEAELKAGGRTVGPIERQTVIYTSAGNNPIVLDFKAVVTP